MNSHNRSFEESDLVLFKLGKSKRNRYGIVLRNEPMEPFMLIYYQGVNHNICRQNVVENLTR